MVNESIPPVGMHFGKHDLDRYGIFAEMSYLHGKKYNYPITSPQIRDRDPKLKQMLTRFPKIKAGLQDCYFDKKFLRIFIGEAYGPSRKKKPDKTKKKGKQEEKPHFKPVSCVHLHSTPGDFYGCFTKKMKAFDPRVRPPKIVKKGKKEEEKPLFKYTSPGKKGGYGYLNITINKYPKYMPSPYIVRPKPEKAGKKKKEEPPNWKPNSPGSFFQKTYASDKVTYKKTVPAEWTLGDIHFKPNSHSKTLDGNMEGCFSKWPAHSKDKYIEPWKIDKVREEMEMKKKGAKQKKKKGKEEDQVHWKVSGKGHSHPTPSVMGRKINITTNEKSWRNQLPVTFTREFI